MKCHNVKDKSIIIFQQVYDGRVVTIFNQPDTPNLYGFSIVDEKYRNKQKYTTWDCLLLDKESLIKICDFIKNQQYLIQSLYVKCNCFSELLEVSDLNNIIYLTIWDNYFSRYNKKIFKSDAWLLYDEAQEFANTLLSKLS
jgi:hypothetical protein